MKKSFFIFLLLLFPALSFAQPSISIDSETHDFGKVSGDGELSHVFRMMNSGDQVLTIEKVVAG
jgi:hypothetical protein